MTTINNSTSIIVSTRQRDNPLLNHIKNVPFEFSKEISPDYIVGGTACALFVSVQYHLTHPLYVHRRIKDLGKDFRLRILLVYVDTDENTNALHDLNKISFSNDLTLILAWSNVEAARYLETCKSYETKPASAIQEREETEFLPRMTSVLTSVKSVNKTDVVTLLEVFGNFRGLCAASEQQLMLCQGMGEKKVKRLFQALHEPINKRTKKSKGISEAASTASAATVPAQEVIGSHEIV